jgi:hypothetical protein
VAKKPDAPITLVVRRGALRRFNKLQKETRNLPVVVTWDRRDSAGFSPRNGDQDEQERRSQPSFTWDLADFIVVPGDSGGESGGDNGGGS